MPLKGIFWAVYLFSRKLDLILLQCLLEQLEFDFMSPPESARQQGLCINLCYVVKLGCGR